MTYRDYAPGEIGRLGEEIYERRIREQVEKGNRGKFVVLDVETGDYVIGTDRMALSVQLQEKRPGAPLYAVRIGYPYASRVGFSPRRAAL